MNDKNNFDKHVKAYLEETTELLADLELSLMGLENRSDDFELLNKIFRTLHTIKGSAGMFGFDHITSFTHDIETVYDHIRNGSIKITKEIIDLTLAAKDQISLMTKGEQYQNYTDVEFILSSFKKMIAEFQSPGKSVAEVIKSEDNSVDQDDKNQLTETYFIKFKPDQGLFLTGTNPLPLLSELRELGNLQLLVNTKDIPSLEENDPEKCYTSWEMSLQTDKGIDAIKDVFIFVTEDCELEIKQNVQAEKAAVLKSVPTVKKVKEEGEVRQETAAVSSLRVSADKLDELVNLVGELVITQARLSQLASTNSDPAFVSVAEEVERLTWSLRDSAMNIRMLPIGSTFSRFIRLVRDLSKDLGKEVELTTNGAETELDKTVIEHLNDPLIHIIRNCIDHGIESPDDREKTGKSRTGNIQLAASQSGGSVMITINDDGAGMNRDAIKAKAVKMGILSESTVLSDSEIYALVMSAGFSTAKTVTNISGRGVGMDVVKRAIDNLRGTIEISSQPGKGTSITLKLPLTLAIIDGLLVGIGDDKYVLPLSTIEECIELPQTERERAHGRNLVSIRGNIIPYISLREKFRIETSVPEIEQVVIATINKARVGFAVDKVFGQHQTVLKTLGRFYKHVEGISGATIMGDGSVALILDIRKLVEQAETEEKLLTAKI